MFNNEIFNEYNGFKQKIELELDTQTKNFNGEFNKYKKCQNCGKIWFYYMDVQIHNVVKEVLLKIKFLEDIKIFYL